jgi:soluble lytic murein transglycosylase-like protein
MLVAVHLALVVPVAADVYMHEDEDGVLHLTNVPVDSVVHRVLEERPRLAVEAVPQPPPVIGTASSGTSSVAYDDLIADGAERYGIDFSLVKAVIRAESAFDPFAVSKKGALGLMQLMPETARVRGVRNAFVPAENIDGGIRHLRLLLDRYEGNVVLAVAAYNAGAGRVDGAGGVPAIAETRDYVARVLRYRAEYVQQRAQRLAARR